MDNSLYMEWASILSGKAFFCDGAKLHHKKNREDCKAKPCTKKVK
jgi:hypothetical protein